MIPQYDSLATSSFFLYLDNRISNQSGFYNISAKAYPINQTINGYQTYSFPYSQVVADISISGANQLTGLYINNNYITRGQSGWSGVNFDKGQLMFNPSLPKNTEVSGSYAVKEINCILSNFPDISVLFESKQQLRSKMPFSQTGINNNIITYPVVFIENASAPSNTPWEIGGVDQTRSVFNVYGFCENLYQKNCLMTILKDMAWKYVPLLSLEEMPFNNLGDYKNGVEYNYEELTNGHIQSGRAALIESVSVDEWGKRTIMSDIEKLTTDAFFVLAEVTMWARRVTK